jgi:hypothetical protein
MKKNYLLSQMKQFVLASTLMTFVVIGLSLTHSFDQDYMAKVEKYEREVQVLADYDDAEKAKNDVALAD